MEIVDYTKDKNLPVLIGCDANLIMCAGGALIITQGRS